ncbi:hypothetical protein D1007_51350 [Hordeum vulgare]|nr:hypothetical protein D1007_51350 [Hordeum vulgare]
MSSDSESDGVAPGSVWPSSVTVTQTEDLARFGLCVPPSAKLSRPWRISTDGHPTLGPPASREELRRHPGGWYDRKGCHRFWTSKNFNNVVGAFRRAARGVPTGNILWQASPSHRLGLSAGCGGGGARRGAGGGAEVEDWLRSSSDDDGAGGESDDDGGDGRRRDGGYRPHGRGLD